MLLQLENATDPHSREKTIYHGYIFIPSSLFPFIPYLHLIHTDSWSSAGAGEEEGFIDPPAQDKLGGGGGGKERGYTVASQPSSTSVMQNCLCVFIYVCTWLFVHMCTLLYVYAKLNMCTGYRRGIFLILIDSLPLASSSSTQELLPVTAVSGGWAAWKMHKEMVHLCTETTPLLCLSQRATTKETKIINICSKKKKKSL